MATQPDVLHSEARYDDVKKYYGEVVQESSELKTSASCVSGAVPTRLREALGLINDEIKAKYYGCGSPIPLCIEGLKILDLGCGTGRDCYVMSKLTGSDGFVYGIDMTKNQIAVARKYTDEQTTAFGYSKPNVEFIFDYIENLHKHFKSESLDLVTSNCVINLTENNEVILRQVYEVLKFGGEIYFSNVYADRRIPEEISRDPVLRGECLGGALYYKDFEAIARKVGFGFPRICSSKSIDIKDEHIQEMVGNAKFYSVTYRLWKIQGLEETYEDYGHVATYRGNIPESPLKFELDNRHIFYRNKPERICGNTALILQESRFREYFEVVGSFEEHSGAFIDQRKPTRENKSKPIESSCCL